MVEMFVSFVLVVAVLFAVSGVISAVIAGSSPIHTLTRRARITRVVRQESADLDRRYELLLHI
ncbi:MAG: hypothetical protein ACR2LI_04110 [Propionibacteriaceae bacterium]